MTELLVVDDDKQNRYMAEVLLASNGYEVSLATNGAEALELARHRIPDLIIADILMPVMDGFALCREWKSDDRLKSVPFIFYTATYTESEDEAFALSLGADRFIVKPVDPKRLLANVLEVLEQSIVNPPALPQTKVATDDVFLKQYNQTLINKLEAKVKQLENTNKILEHEVKSRKRAQEDMRQMERQLIQSQKMEAIGTLAGGIAHDFNNILMAIMGLVDLAKIHTREGKTPERHLEEVIDACNRAKELVAQILTFSRQSDILRKPIQIKTIVKEVLKMLRASLPSTIVLGQDLRSDSLILANPTQIYQVLMNLCTNAGQAMKADGGKIHVALSEVALSEAFVSRHDGMKPGQFLKLEVTDDGVGIPSDQLGRVFDPYFTTKEIGEGTGLGLSVVHGIVKDSGGTITVESEAGKGSTFNLYLPVLDATVDADRPTTALPAGGQEHLLLIDDEPILVNTGSEFLKKLGYHVTAFNSSKDALEAFSNRPADYDLVITDMTMPGLTGAALTREMLQIRSDLPVILCTGYNDKITRREADRLGAKAFMMKPFTMHDLSRNIRLLLDGVPAEDE